MISKCSSKHILAFFLVLLALSATSLATATWVLHFKYLHLTTAPHPRGLTPLMVHLLTAASGVSVLSAAAGFANSYLICFNSYQGCLAINAVLATVSVVLEGACLVMFFELKMDYWRFLDVTLKDSLTSYGTDATVAKRWDSLQEAVECCGLRGPGDWAFANNTSGIPASCCTKSGSAPSDSSALRCNTTDGAQINWKGCAAELDNMFEEGFGWWTKITLIVFTLTFIGLLYNVLLLTIRLSCCSFCPCS